MKQIATWIEKDRNKHFDEIFATTDFKVWNAREQDVPWNEISGLMLTGGCDISQEYLQQPVPDSSLIKDPEPDRDKWEFPVVRRALLQRMPIFAICRGHQVLNVALGGTLLLDIPGHALPEQKYGNIQELKYEPGAEIQIPLVNSSHHQAIDQLGEGLVVEARHAGDGIIEQVRLRDYPFCLGVQYHPERDVIYKPLFEAFFEHIR